MTFCKCCGRDQIVTCICGFCVDCVERYGHDNINKTGNKKMLTEKINSSLTPEDRIYITKQIAKVLTIEDIKKVEDEIYARQKWRKKL